MEAKNCVVCGAAFERPHGVVPSVWATRTCCSRACGAKLPRLERYTDPSSKACAQCGVTFTRPPGYRSQQWALRKYCSRECMGKARTARAWEAGLVKTCPICRAEFRTPPSQSHLRHTCGSRDCKREYRRTVVAPKQAATARANYASGKRKPGRGISARETDLWPYLADEGWCWRMKWTDAFGVFEMDFCLPDRKLNVEIDGEEHRWPRGRAKDARRDGELQRRGWRILRIPNEDVDADPAGMAARIMGWAG